MNIASLARITILRPRFCMRLSKFFKKSDFDICLSTNPRNKNRPRMNMAAAPMVLPRFATSIPGKKPNRNPAEIVIKDAGSEKTPRMKYRLA